jgi:hypothetical protein
LSGTQNKTVKIISENVLNVDMVQVADFFYDGQPQPYRLAGWIGFVKAIEQFFRFGNFYGSRVAD